MSAIGSDLNFGGTKAYVIASHVRDRGGLVLLQPVTLETLNGTPPRDLRIEHTQQKALEHNTLVKLGHIDGEYVNVPDPESGLNLTDRAGNVKLTWNVEGETTDRGHPKGGPKHTCEGLECKEDTATSG